MPPFTHPLQDALETVRTLRRSLNDTRRFTGWSGPGRMVSGALALCMSLFLLWGGLPREAETHILAWGLIFLMAMLINVGALLHWYMHDRSYAKSFRSLKPLLDVIPPLGVGALFTLVLLLRKDMDLLFGVWMCMFGLTNLASRYVLPRAISIVGVFYVAAGAMCLLTPGIQFLDAWPMGVVFAAGEVAGGFVLYVDKRRYSALQRAAAAMQEGDAE